MAPIFRSRPARRSVGSFHFGSFHLIPGQGRIGVDDLLAAKEKRVALESYIDAAGIPGVDRRFYRPTPKTGLVGEDGARNRRGLSPLRLGDLPVLHGVRILQVLMKVLPDRLFGLNRHFAVLRSKRLSRRLRARE